MKMSGLICPAASCCRGIRRRATFGRACSTVPGGGQDFFVHFFGVLETSVHVGTSVGQCGWMIRN